VSCSGVEQTRNRSEIAILDLRRLEMETRKVNVLVLQSKDRIVVLHSKHNNSDGAVC